MEGYPTYPVGPLIEPVGFGAPLVPAAAPEPLPFAVQQPEPLELSTPADEDSWRYSRFALPWLLTCLGWLFAVFCLTFWQQSGDVKRLYDGVPRLIELHSAGQSKYEGGLPKSLRNLRIATGWFGFFGVLIALGVFLARPKRNIRVALNFLCVALLAVSSVIAWIEFGIALGKYSTLVHCPDMNRWTLQKCTPRVAYETVAIALDAAVGVSTIVALLLLAYNTQKNHWKLAPRDWDEAIEDTQERPKERAPGEKAMRNVSFVRKWLTGLALLFCLATLIALQVFVVILHEQRQKEFLYGERGRADSGLDAHSRQVFEHAGWATVNTRIRYSAVGIGIVSVLLNFLPFRAKIIALVFAFIYFATGVILLVGFGFDLYELRISRGCGSTVDGLELDCNRGSFISTVIIEFLAAFWLFIYLLVEYVLLKRRQCQHCERAYEMPDLIKHETSDCPARPVRCEVCAKSMSFKEFDAHKSACSVDHVRCKGCNTVVPKWGFKGHQEECPRCSVRCTMCEEAFQRCDMPHHVMVCPNRPASCDACGETFRTRDMDAHRAVCGEVLVQCELCQDFMQRFRLQQHDQHHCPKRLVRCSRCHQEVPRFRWERHVQRECAL